MTPESVTDVRGYAFFVPGIPQPKGSTVSRAFHTPSGRLHIATRSANPKLKGWQYQVAAIAAQKGVQPLQGAVRVTAQFYLRRPKSLPKRVVHHTRRPDVDKLLRAIFDGLTGIAYRDDAQVVRVVVDKQHGSPSGVWITVEAVK